MGSNPLTEVAKSKKKKKKRGKNKWQEKKTW
jgi:hypothetical protein